MGAFQIANACKFFGASNPCRCFLPRKLLIDGQNPLRLVGILAFPSLMNMLTQYLASLLDVLFLRDGLQKYSFQVVSFRNRTYAKSLETCKRFDVDFALCLTK